MSQSGVPLSVSGLVPVVIGEATRDETGHRAAIIRRSVAPLFALVILLLAGSISLFASEYWLSAILTPFLILSLAGVGLNILTGYTGLLSLGSAAFMAIGAFAAYDLQRYGHVPFLLSLFLGGAVAAVFGVIAGLPSLRIRGFYLIVSTLALQFLVLWVLTQFGWFSNYSSSGVISAPPIIITGWQADSPAGHYLVTLVIVWLLTLAAYRLLYRTRLGRSFLAVRDMEIAARTSGIAVFGVKLWAFAISSFYLGVAGALWAFTYLGTVEPNGFDLSRSFQVLFIVLIGGLGRLSGGYLGAAFIVLFPIALSQILHAVTGNSVDGAVIENIQKVVFGALIIAFLIKEPEGLARLLQCVARFRVGRAQAGKREQTT